MAPRKWSKARKDGLNLIESYGTQGTNAGSAQDFTERHLKYFHLNSVVKSLAECFAFCTIKVLFCATYVNF